AREPEIGREHVDQGVEQVGGARLVARHHLDRGHPALQFQLLLSVALALGDDRLQTSQFLLVVLDVPAQTRHLSRQRPPVRSEGDDDQETQGAEDQAQVDAGDTKSLCRAREWRCEIDLDHEDLSPGVRSPRPTATANRGPRSCCSASVRLAAEQSSAANGRASSTGTPQDEARKSSMPASLAQPPDSTILPI